ncbi:MAG TPA: hypothetical protein VLJ86_19800 [Ramlibacter sp.]|nr:hypothetical protein [Ramlibacter sp.]
MTHHLAFLRRLPVVAVATLAGALAGGAAFAEDIRMETTPFVSTAQRAQVANDFRQQSLRARHSDDFAYENPQLRTRTSLTRAQAKGEYVAARKEVAAVTSEDSGAAYFRAMPRRASTATMGAPGN